MEKSKKIFDATFNSLILKLGTNAGTIISIITLVGMGFSAGTYYNDYKKNIEILDLKTMHFKEVQELSLEIKLKKIELQQYILNKDEKESKK